MNRELEPADQALLNSQSEEDEDGEGSAPLRAMDEIIGDLAAATQGSEEARVLFDEFNTAVKKETKLKSAVSIVYEALRSVWAQGLGMLSIYFTNMTG